MPGAVKRKPRKLVEITCELCGEKSMKRPGGRFCSKRCGVTWQRANCVINYPAGEKHYAWKGDLTEYKSIHQRINRARGPARGCVNRSQQGCTSQKYEWAHIHGTNPQNTDNYQQMCKSCHITYDDQRGSGHTNSKLTPEQVATIRSKYAAGGRSQQALADEFGVNQTTVSNIVRGATYKLAA